MKTTRRRSVAWLLLAIVCAASMEFYAAKIWSAQQPARFSDLYAPWWGAHELLLHHRNPYSPAVAHEIQTVIYGAPVNPTPDDPSGIAGGFAYPPYAALLLWPLAHLSFPMAQSVFFWASLLATLISLALWLRASRFELPPLQSTTVALFLVGSFPVLQGLQLHNLSLIAAAFLAMTFFLLSADHFILAGIFLAASTFKPQFTVVLIPWLALWASGDWRRRRSLAWSFLITMLLLLLVSKWLMPGGISVFLHIVRAYRHYTYGHSLLDVWFTPSFGPAAAAVLLLIVLALCWPVRSQSADSPRFFLAISLLLAATVVVIPTLAPHAQLLLLPGFLTLLRDYSLLGSSSLTRLAVASAWTLLAWPWMVAFALLTASFWYPATRLLGFWAIPLYSSPLLPLLMVLALGCLLRRPSFPAIR